MFLFARIDTVLSTWNQTKLRLSRLLVCSGMPSSSLCCTCSMFSNTQPSPAISVATHTADTERLLARSLFMCLWFVCGTYSVVVFWLKLRDSEKKPECEPDLDIDLSSVTLLRNKTRIYFTHRVAPGSNTETWHVPVLTCSLNCHPVNWLLPRRYSFVWCKSVCHIYTNERALAAVQQSLRNYIPESFFGTFDRH